MKTQYFGFLTSLSEEELRNSPRLQSHASGALLGITHIVNGLENPVRLKTKHVYKLIFIRNFQVKKVYLYCLKYKF